MYFKEQRIEEKIMQAVGKRVKYAYPGGAIRSGVLQDRVITHEPNSNYWNVIDLIHFHGEGDLAVRFGSYRQSKTGLSWCKGSTFTRSMEGWKRQFVAASEKSWFKNMLLDAVDKLKEGRDAR